MAKIQITNLSYSYEGTAENIFDQINLVLDTDWKLGLIGRNGRGKTTLLNLLMGKLSYQGKITTTAQMQYFPFFIKQKENMTLEILENTIPQLEEWRVMKELNLSQTNPEILYRSFSTLSGGEQMKVLLAGLFSQENNFLLLDEPTNHLDEKTKRQLEQYLAKKKGYILVSHDRAFLDHTVDHIVSINAQGIELIKGNYSTWKENYERRNQFEIMQNEKLKQQIQKLEKASQDTANWAGKIEASKIGDGHVDKGFIGHKSAKMMKTSKTIEKRKEKIKEEKQELLKNLDRMDPLILKPLWYEKKQLVSTKDLAILYGDKTVCSAVNFSLERGERLAITGKNGSGKSSLLKLLQGQQINYQGILKKGQQMKLSYIAQNTDFLTGKTIRQLAQENQIDETVFKAMLAKLDVSSLEFEKEIGRMSEGQKKKILLAKSITESADLYLWDEPLNYIDIPSRIQIEEAILKYQPTLVFIEHDLTFVKNVATKKMTLN